MNRHQFQYAARQFRAGKTSLNEFTDQVLGVAGETAGCADGETQLPEIPPRQPESHKGDYGRVSVVAGSRGMAGAAALAGMAALRSGAGLVTVATPVGSQPVVAAFHPAIMTVGIPEDSAGRLAVASGGELLEQIPPFDCLAIGPGLGITPALQTILQHVFTELPQPVVLDADGLNNLAGSMDQGLRAGGPRILTPHPGELRRLVSVAGDSRKDLESASIDLASRLGCVVVLKGHRTLITDGSRHHHNETGNPGMATAGSGDVLTGIIAALVGQGMDIWSAAVLGCHVHGAAGDAMVRQTGLHSLVATDIIEGLPGVLK